MMTDAGRRWKPRLVLPELLELVAREQSVLQFRSARKDASGDVNVE